MAGAVKHMERSHRSHRRSDSIYNDFHRKAYDRKTKREARLTLGQRFAKMVKPLMQHAKKSTEK